MIGSFFCDVVFSGLPRLPVTGEEIWAEACSIVPGGTYITAAALSRLQVSTAWACRFGTDPFSAFAREAARREGIDSSAFAEVDAPIRNISVALSVGGERSFVSFADALEPMALTSVQDLRPRLVIRPGLGSLDDLARVLDAAHDVGALVFLDPQSTEHTLESERLRALLGRVDFFAPNEREALNLTQTDNIDTALTILRDVVPFVIVKQGSAGATAADRDFHVRIPALPIQAFETTGAGDCFNAGYIMAMLDGSDVQECLRTGNAAGGLSTLAPSSAGIPWRADVERARETYRAR